MSDRLEGKIALVTGAGSGLGQGMVDVLAAAGADLALHYHSNQNAVAQAESLVESYGRKAFVVQGDLATPDGPSLVCDQVEAELGAIDILVNNAGGWVEKPLLETTTAEWDMMLDIDLRAVYLMIRRAATGMIERRRGRIINISSVASLDYVPGEGIYGVCKAGVNMLTKAYAAELAPFGVTVNAIAPAWSLPFAEPYPPSADNFPQCADVPNGRPGHARDVAALLGYLVSPVAQHMTGQVLPIDGGLSVTMAKGR